MNHFNLLGLLSRAKLQPFETQPYDHAVPLVFMHVPRTSGTALTHALIEAVAPRRVLYVLDRVLFGDFEAFDSADPALRQNVYLNPADLPPDADFVCGHTSFFTPLQRYRTAQFITFLREPVSRIISHWLYLRSLPDERLRAWGAWGEHMAKVRESLIAFISGRDSAAETDNLHLRMLLWPHPLIPNNHFIDERNDAALAREAIVRLKEFAYVDVFENPGLEVNLRAWLGRPFQYSVRNASDFWNCNEPISAMQRTPLHKELTSDVFDLLETRSRLDLKLWMALARQRVSSTEPETLRERALMRNIARYSLQMMT